MKSPPSPSTPARTRSSWAVPRCWCKYAPAATCPTSPRASAKRWDSKAGPKHHALRDHCKAQLELITSILIFEEWFIMFIRRKSNKFFTFIFLLLITGESTNDKRCQFSSTMTSHSWYHWTSASIFCCSTEHLPLQQKSCCPCCQAPRQNTLDMWRKNWFRNHLFLVQSKMLIFGEGTEGHLHLSSTSCSLQNESKKPPICFRIQGAVSCSVPGSGGTWASKIGAMFLFQFNNSVTAIKALFFSVIIFFIMEKKLTKLLKTWGSGLNARDEHQESFLVRIGKAIKNWMESLANRWWPKTPWCWFVLLAVGRSVVTKNTVDFNELGNLETLCFENLSCIFYVGAWKSFHRRPPQLKVGIRSCRPQRPRGRFAEDPYPANQDSPNVFIQKMCIQVYKTWSSPRAPRW